MYDYAHCLHIIDKDSIFPSLFFVAPVTARTLAADNSCGSDYTLYFEYTHALPVATNKRYFEPVMSERRTHKVVLDLIRQDDFFLIRLGGTDKTSAPSAVCLLVRVVYNVKLSLQNSESCYDGAKMYTNPFFLAHTMLIFYMRTFIRV